MNTKRLDYAETIKYLGLTISSDKKDDNDMLRRMETLYAISNRLLRLFLRCSTDFVVTVLAFIAHFYGLIIRSQLTASLELLLTISIVAY